MNKLGASLAGLLAALALGGCSSMKNILSQEVFNKAGTEWVDAKDKTAFVFGTATLTETDLVVPVKCYQTKVELAFDEYYWKPYGQKSGPSPRRYHKKNVRLTGALRKEEVRCPTSEAQLVLTGVRASGMAINPSVSDTAVLEAEAFTFALKPLAQSLARKPTTLVATVSLPGQPNNVVKTTLAASEVAAMKLQSENWLSREALTTLLMTRIVAAIKANDYQAALPWFRKLEKRGKNMPQAFHYYYIAALAASGNTAAARARMDAYVKKYGKYGKYYDQVTDLMKQGDRMH